MSWFDRILAPTNNNNASTRHNIPEGVWTKCEACDQVLYRAELERNLFVCPKCNHHMKISARERLIRFMPRKMWMWKELLVLQGLKMRVLM